MADSHKPRILGEDVVLLGKMAQRGPQQMFGLSRGNGLSSIPMRSRLTKLLRLGIVAYDADTLEYSLTDIGRSLLSAVEAHKKVDPRFDPTLPGWSREWEVVKSVMLLYHDA